MWCYDRRPIHVEGRSTDPFIEKTMSRSLARPRRGDPGEHGSDPPHASGRPVRGSLSIGRLTQHHVVLGPSTNPRGGTLNRPVYRKTDAPLTRSAAYIEVIRASTDRTLPTRLVGRYAGR